MAGNFSDDSEGNHNDSPPRLLSKYISPFKCAKVAKHGIL